MLRMGFAEEWVELVMRCISTTSYVVTINGRNGDIFKPTRDLRQGNPLSPFLFLICSEGLSSLIRLATKDGLIKSVKASRRGPVISHLLFVDDCILFGEATKGGIRILKDILREYERCSSQCVNFNKSTIFFSLNMIEEDKKEISNDMGVRCLINMEKYLGLPNVVGRRKKESFQNLKDRIRQRIANWSIRLLSQGGKEVFIKRDNFRLSTEINAMRDLKVSNLNDSNNRIWNNELIRNTFPVEDAAKILRIPLALAPHNNFLT
ncbi:hypothetical protein PVK06_039926 [Gossypium arboreum]|uniref:Reverse transcriptase domain-containing protein n=1 Tax=Gossypium arboreum TaxID=29729 RepID=A0ABR0N6B0_GOSAR|nr:hypothetical protein PVK06_039926 [Gossypium arboreum]